MNRPRQNQTGLYRPRKPYSWFPCVVLWVRVPREASQPEKTVRVLAGSSSGVTVETLSSCFLRRQGWGQDDQMDSVQQ